MNLPWISLFLMFIIHFVMVVMLLVSNKRLGKGVKDRKKDPLYGHLVAALAYAIIFAFHAWGLYLRWFSPGNVIHIIYGSMIFMLGAYIRVWAVRTLGLFFTMEIGIRENHEVVTNGPYRWMRHPSYTGYLLMILGFGIASQHLIVLLVPLFETIIFLGVRIPQEERLLLEELGENYQSYSDKTKRLIPLIF